MRNADGILVVLWILQESGGGRQGEDVPSQVAG
jgi:hypothetical protein